MFLITFEITELTMAEKPYMIPVPSTYLNFMCACVRMWDILVRNLFLTQNSLIFYHSHSYYCLGFLWVSNIPGILLKGFALVSSASKFLLSDLPRSASLLFRFSSSVTFSRTFLDQPVYTCPTSTPSLSLLLCCFSSQ